MQSAQSPAQTPAPPAMDTASATPAADATGQDLVGNAAIQDQMSGGAADPLAGNVETGTSSVETLAFALQGALYQSDMPTIYRVLSRPDREAIKAHYDTELKRYGSFPGDARQWLEELDAIVATSYYLHGKADLHAQVLIVTRGMYGTDEDALFKLLELAPPAELLALAEKDVTWMNELSGPQFDRVAWLMKPYITQAGSEEQLDEEVRKRFLESMAADQITDEALLERLKARKGWLDDDEEGMLEDVRAFAEARGPIEDVDVQMEGVLAWLQGELSAAMFLEAKNTLKTANERGLAEKMEEAAAETSLFGLVSNPDEQKMYDAIESSNADQRAAYAKSDGAKDLSATIGSSDAEHATAMLTHEGGGVAALDELLAALEGTLWISDQEVFAALEKMPTDGLARVRDDAQLREKIEGGLSAANVERFHEMVGWRPTESGAEILAAGDLKASPERMVARVEAATGKTLTTTDTDTVFEALIEFRNAGGHLTMPEHDALWDRFSACLWIYSSETRTFLWDVVSGTKPITEKDRLRFATAAVLGTDDAGVDETIADVGNEELVRGWSNLPDFHQQARDLPPEEVVAAAKAFVPDISEEVRGWLTGDRSNAVDDIGTLRDKLVVALKSPEGAQVALEEFGYSADARALMALQYQQAEDLAERSRGDGFMNGVSSFFVDPFTAKDEQLDQAYGEYQGAAAGAVQEQRGSAEEARQLEQVEQERQEFIAANDGYEELKTATAQVASTIVGAVVSVLVTIASAGTASPAAAALLTAMCGAAASEMTKAAIEGQQYDVEAGATALTKALVTGVVAMPLGPLAEKLSSGIGSTAFAKLVVAEVDSIAPGVGSKLLPKLAGSTLEATIKEFPTTYAGAAVETEGLLRKGIDGAVPILQDTAKEWAIGVVSTGVQYKVGLHEAAIDELAQSGKWDEHVDALVKAGLVDVMVTSAAEKLIAGEALGPEEWVELVCKVVETVHGAQNDASETKESMTKTLEWINTAHPTELQKLEGISPAVVEAIVAKRRENGGFGTLSSLRLVVGFDEEVLVPAAREIVADFETKRTAAPQSAAAPAGGT